MKVKELQENDLVSWWNPREKRWITIKVTLELLLGYKQNNNLDPIDLCGIKLTSEILKTYGYTLEEHAGLKEWVSQDGRVILRNDQNYINSNRKWAIHVDSPDMSTICTAELDYLHQLQHILRHCELEGDLDVP